MQFSDPHSFTDTEQGKIAHIQFWIDVDFSAKVLKIKATYRLEETVSGSFFLDTRDLKINRVYKDDQEILWEIDQHDSIVGDRLHLKDLDGHSEFTIEVTTAPEASALQWVTPKQTAGGEHPFLYSQCQAIHARSIFPCQDSPSVRFTYEATVEVQRPLVAVMAAEHIETEHLEETSQYRYRMPQPIPSYLFGIAIGNLAFEELGPHTGVYSEPEILESAVWEFAENEKRLVEAEKLFGPYLWDRYDVLILPPSFPYGGMENPRLTFLTPSCILGDRSRTPLVSHELAHAWTGNLVTNATWEDFWLNEGWTTYAESRITEVLEGDDYSQLLCFIGRYLMFRVMERFGMDSDKTCLKYSQRGIDPDEVFSVIPYIKGSSFVLKLERSVGREVFDAFIKKYIATFSFQSLTTEGFISFLEQELPGAIKNVDIDEWLYAPGYPESAPALSSSLFDDVKARIDAYESGVLPDSHLVADWIPDQIRLFLLMLPERIPVEDCRHIERIFNLKDTHNYFMMNRFYQIAVRSGYQDVLPGIELMVGSDGRMVNLAMIFRTMVKEDWTREKARPMFERHRDRHHPTTVAVIEGILSKAGL
ncbi:MAG: leukotriene A4 hydrolase C-terminal domain-containing protein [Chloroflexota bacterium]|nr:leukotriene A4 hydrolase C-terminal domain-containing protein [Chloroflexota bacterium]